MVKEDEENFDLLQLDIGNILPGQTLKVEIKMVQPIKAEYGYFEFNFPLTYFPKY